MNALPGAVQRQLDAATAIEAQMAAQSEQAAQPAQSVQALLQSPPPEDAKPQEKPAAAPSSAPPKDDFEHKYRVLQGMYEADVTRVKARLAEQGREHQELKDRLAAMEAARSEAPQANEQDLEKFGADLIGMVQRYTEQSVGSLMARVSALEQRVGAVDEKATGTAAKGFLKELADAVPNFLEINEDPRWLQWLGQVDPMFGEPRQAALDRAHAARDAARVAVFFKNFLATLPAAPDPGPGLAEQIAPETAGNPAPRREQAKPTITQQAIAAFYDDVAKRRYVGRETEMNALETQINLAIAEGRVV